MASISRRAFIQWLPEKPSEPTSTVVLTSPQSRFVDIRLLQDRSQGRPVSRQGPNAADDGLAGTVFLADIDWAFAGVSRSTWQNNKDAQSVLNGIDLDQYHAFKKTPSARSTGDGTPSRVQHTTWTHTIDSRFAAADSVQDEGDMLHVASLDMTIERGNMCNPSTGLSTDYVEGWLDDPVEPTSYTVLELANEHTQAKGLFIKLGPWMQGVARTNDGFSLQQWHCDGGSWTPQVTLGSVGFPVQLQDAHDIGTLLTVSKDGQDWHWRVVEAGNA